MSEWPMVKLGEVAKVVSGGTPKTSVPEYWDGDVPWVTPKDLSNNKKLWISSGSRSITELGLAKSGAILLPGQTVLWSSRAPIGLVAIASNPIATNQGFKSFIPGNKLDSSYLAHFVMQSQAALQNLGVGATFKEVSAQRAAEIRIPLPPLGEQKRIAEMLDQVATMIDLVKSEISKMQALIGELLRRLVSNDVEKKSLGAITSSKPDYGIGQSSVPYDPSVGRYVRITDINDFGELQDKAVSPQQGETSLPAKKLLRPGDLIIARSGATVGKAYLHYHKEIPHWFAGYLIRFVIDSKIISPEIVFDYTKTNEYQAWIDGRKQTVAQPNISAKIYSQELQIPIPLQDDQEIYLQKRKEVYKVIKLLHRKLTLLRELQHSLSARAFAGEL